MSAQFFRGTQLDQNVKFKDKDKQLIKQKKWPANFEQKVDLQKVQTDVIKPWIERRLTQLMGYEDEIVISYAQSQIEQAKLANQICPKQIHLYLTGFMEDKTTQFVQELWNLLLEAQNNEVGVPKSLIEEKEKEIQLKKELFENTQIKIQKLNEINKNKEEQKETEWSQRPKKRYDSQSPERKDHRRQENHEIRKRKDSREKWPWEGSRDNRRRRDSRERRRHDSTEHRHRRNSKERRRNDSKDRYREDSRERRHNYSRDYKRKHHRSSSSSSYEHSRRK